MTIEKQIENLRIGTVPMTRHEIELLVEIANNHAEKFAHFMIMENSAKQDEGIKTSAFYFNERGLFEGPIKKYLERYNNGKG